MQKEATTSHRSPKGPVAPWKSGALASRKVRLNGLQSLQSVTKPPQRPFISFESLSKHLPAGRLPAGDEKSA